LKQISASLGQAISTVIMYGTLPRSVVAYGWIPFLVIAGLSFLFSIAYVIIHRASRPKYHFTTIVTILGLFFTLISSILVPLDVFLTSYMKHTDGTWREWASTVEQRESIKSSIQYGYYASYSVILTFCFFIFPANLFYHGVSGQEDAGEPFRQKICRSFLYTFISLFLFGLLVLAGIFIPFNGSPPDGLSAWQKIQWFIEKLANNKGDDLIIFILNVINTIGMVILVTYTGFGLSALPLGIINAKRAVDRENRTVVTSIQEYEAQIESIVARSGHGTPQMYEQSQIDRLEQQVRLLERERRDLEQQAKNVVNRCRLLFMPCQMAFGVVIGCIGFLIFLSLLLENIDKAMNSLGPYSGYTLKNSSLPNPLDFVLIFAQKIFPIDYIVYTGTVLFLILCSMSGVKALGIRFFCFSIYKVRAWKTHPCGLLLCVLSLMYIIMALNVVMFSLVPEYTTFGNQHYQLVTPENETIVKRCEIQSASEALTECVPSRISVLLLSFHYKAWIFGAANYWLTWGLLVMVCLGAVYTVYRLRRPLRLDEEEEDLMSS